MDKMETHSWSSRSRNLLITGFAYWLIIVILGLIQAFQEDARPMTPYGFQYLQLFIIPVFSLASFFLFALLTKARYSNPPKPILQAFFFILALVLTYWAAIATLRPNWLLLLGVWITYPLLYAADIRLVGQNLLISLVSIFVTLVLLELLLRPFPQIWPRYAQQVGSNWRRIHADIPGISYEEDGITYQSNSLGFRGSDPVADQVDIVALGDSFTFGVGAESPWPSRVSQITGQEVLNLGMGGTDPPKHVYPLVGFGLERSPSFVIEGYFEGNDFFSCYQPARPSAPRWGDHLILPDVFSSLTRMLRAGVRDQSITSALTYNEVTPLEKTINGREVMLTFSPAYSATLTMDRETLARSENWRIATGSLLRMKDLTENAGAKFLLVFIPDRTHVYWPLIREDDTILETLNEDMIYHWQESFGCQVLEPGRLPDALDLFRRSMDRTINDQRALLTEFARTEGIHLLDLTGPLQELASQGITLHDPLETHYNDFVNQQIAEWIAQEIARLEE